MVVPGERVGVAAPPSETPAHARRGEALPVRARPTGGHGPTSSSALLDPADLMIGAVVGAFALWSLAFWIGLSIGVGWALAGPLWIAGCVGTGVLWWRSTGRRRLDLTGWSGTRAAWIVTAGVVAAAIGSPWAGGRFVAVPVVVLLLLWGEPDIRAGGGSPAPVGERGAGATVVGIGDGIARRLPVLGAAVAVAALGVWFWRPFLAAVAVVVVWLVVAEYRATRSASPGGTTAPGPDAPGPDAPGSGASAVTGGDRPPALTAPVIVVGLAFVAFLLTTQGYNFDHGHYLNKSLHYANDPGSFGIRDYMYGVEGVDHIPRGTILNAFETLVGFLSAVTGIGTVTLTYHVFAPAAGFLLPVGLAWTAREFGARRPDLVGVSGTAVMVMFADSHDAKMVLFRLAEGKLVAGMVALPIFVGAVIRWWRRDEPWVLALSVAAGVATFGASSTAGIALLPAVACATGAGLLSVPRSDLDRGRIARGLLPGATVVLLTGIGFVVHRTIDTGLDRFPDGQSSWLTRLVGRSSEVTVDGSEAPVFLILASVVVVVLAGRTPLQRWFFALALGGLALVVYNPLLFSRLWDPLGIAGLSWRAAWALPLGLAVGLAIDALHGRDATVSNGRLGALAIVALFAIGVSPIADTDQGRPGSFPPQHLEAASALVAATPEGGRFDAPTAVEAAAIGLTDDRYPTMVRPYFLADLATYDDLPVEFAAAERAALSWLLVGGQPDPRLAELAAQATTTDPTSLLGLLEIDAVCLPPTADPRLARVVRETWVRVERTAFCGVFTRP